MMLESRAVLRVMPMKTAGMEGEVGGESGHIVVGEGFLKVWLDVFEW